jgi:hypothetical protein
MTLDERLLGPLLRQPICDQRMAGKGHGRAVPNPKAVELTRFGPRATNIAASIEWPIWVEMQIFAPAVWDDQSAPADSCSDPSSQSGSIPAHLDGWLVFALTQINHMPEQTVSRPLGVADLNDHLRAHPMHPRQRQR